MRLEGGMEVELDDVLLGALRRIATTINGPQTTVEAQRIARAALKLHGDILGNKATEADETRIPPQRARA